MPSFSYRSNLSTGVKNLEGIDGIDKLVNLIAAREFAAVDAFVIV